MKCRPVFSFFHRLIAFFRRLRYPGSRVYWERRYARGGDSGAGSGGVLAEYKANIINDFIAKHGIQSIVELGCGDGRQLALFKVEKYLGLDISPSVIARCRALFEGDPGKHFEVYDPALYRPDPAPLALSLEVLFHLTEADVYDAYLRDLFKSSHRWVIVFSGNSDDPTGGVFPHFKPRHFTSDLPRLAPGWVLMDTLENPHRDISISNFYIFEKNQETV